MYIKFIVTDLFSTFKHFNSVDYLFGFVWERVQKKNDNI